MLVLIRVLFCGTDASDKTTVNLHVKPIGTVCIGKEITVDSATIVYRFKSCHMHSNRKITIKENRYETD